MDQAPAKDVETTVADLLGGTDKFSVFDSKSKKPSKQASNKSNKNSTPARKATPSKATATTPLQAPPTPLPPPTTPLPPPTTVQQVDAGANSNYLNQQQVQQMLAQAFQQFQLQLQQQQSTPSAKTSIVPDTTEVRVIPGMLAYYNSTNAHA